MDKRRSRLFAALLMAVFMMTSVFVAPANVYAAEETNEETKKETKKPNIEVKAKTKDSITLKVEEGYEYAIQITKDDKTEWKWAEDSQYTEDEETHERIEVTFSKLEEGETYIFGKRAQEDKGGKILTQKVELKISESGEDSKKSDEPAIESTEPAIESTEPATEATEPATESTESTTEAATQSGDQNVEPPKETEPPVSVSSPKKASANGVTESKETESKETESKQEDATNPANNNSDVPKESESNQESGASRLAPAAEAPEKPEVASFTDTTVQLKKVEGQEYALINADGRADSWDKTGFFENLKPDTEYNFVTRVEYDSSTVEESKMSETVTVHTKLSAAAAPAIPKMASRTETSITLAAIENGEYGLVQMDAVAENNEGIAAQSEENILWQDSPEFTGLNPGTEYMFKVRMKFDAATAMESLASDSFILQTLVPFEGSTVTGVAMDGVYVSGTKLTATAVGNGMDNVNPTEGDSRWIPRTWNWEQSSFNSWKENYTIPFTLVKVGNYRLNVDFEREEYTDGAWKATGVVQTYTISFKVTAAPITQYTITATSNGNGTIDPQGNITAEHGKDYTFTFTSNNGYKVAKVYVDGVETKVENNKYTFKAVSTNHTISVTFELARKLDSPKTGDSMNMPLAFGVLVVSAVLLAGIFIYSRKKKVKR